MKYYDERNRLIIISSLLVHTLGIYCLYGQQHAVVVQAWNIQSILKSCPDGHLKKQNKIVPSTTTHTNLQSLHHNLRQRKDFLLETTKDIMLLLCLTTGPTLSFPHQVSARNLPISAGADLSKTGTIETLIPIVSLQKKLQNLQRQLEQEHNNMNTIKDKISYPYDDETKFKRMFDAYSDPVSYKQNFLDQNAFLVYYTKGYDGPNRPKLEDSESDGDDGNNKQALQYSIRNDAWIAYDNFLIEYDYYINKTTNRNDKEESFREMMKYLMATIQAIDAYLKLASDTDLEIVQKQAL